MSTQDHRSASIDQITLLLVDQLLKKRQYTIEEVGDILPVVIHSNSENAQLNYINQLGCDFFNLPLNELLSMGKDYAAKYVHEHAREVNDDCIKHQNTKPIINYLQPVTRDKTTIEWFISTKKLLSTELTQTINITYEWKHRKLMHQKMLNFLSIDHYYYSNHDKFMRLSKKEKKIIQYLAQGYSNHDISDLLHNSLHTILDQRKKIYRKIDIKNYFQLLKFAQTFDFF